MTRTLNESCTGSAYDPAGGRDDEYQPCQEKFERQTRYLLELFWFWHGEGVTRPDITLTTSIASIELRLS